jgi:hypothetical protein
MKKLAPRAQGPDGSNSTAAADEISSEEASLDAPGRSQPSSDYFSRVRVGMKHLIFIDDPTAHETIQALAAASSR